jgi:hypothetical protein
MFTDVWEALSSSSVLTPQSHGSETVLYISTDFQEPPQTTGSPGDSHEGMLSNTFKCSFKSSTKDKIYIIMNYIYYSII